MPTNIHGIKFYTIPEVAQDLLVTPQTIRAWIKQGRLIGHRIGRPIYITEIDVINLLNRNKDYITEVKNNE